MECHFEDAYHVVHRTLLKFTWQFTPDEQQIWYDFDLKLFILTRHNTCNALFMLIGILEL